MAIFILHTDNPRVNLGEPGWGAPLLGRGELGIGTLKPCQHSTKTMTYY